MKLEDAQRMKDVLTNLDEDEWAALEHVQNRIEEDGRHDVNACPYPMRAVCRYKRTLASLEAQGLHVPNGRV